MKKLILFIFVSLVFLKTNAQVNAVCCPEKFELKQLINDRECNLVCDSSFKELGTAIGIPNGPVPGQSRSIVACKNSQMTYLVIPNLPGFTYTWVVTGGSVISPNPGNPVTINWGNATKGSIVVTITNADGSCVRKIAYDICLLDKPVAGFSFSPSSPLCINNLIQFNNTSLGGATYFWSFGNGQTSTDVNPQYTYTVPGTYVVTLVVKSKSNGCGCTDSIQQTIVVNDGPGISGCDKMLCPGDTATYCSTKTCGSYSWSVNGGTIIGSSTQNCVRVVWSNTQPGTLPATITLNTTGCGACNTTTLPVNIVWPAIPIQGNTVVCVGSTETYWLPVMPGTFYSWSLSGGGNIVNSGLYPTGYPNNNPQINIDWTTPGNYNLTVNYYNPNTKKKCGGSYILPITVKPKFKITGMTSVCAGLTGTYMTQDFSSADWTVTGGVLGTDYTFSTGPNGVSNFQVNWITSGVYQVCGQPITANIPNYCNANPVCVSVLVKPTPVVTVGGSNLVCPNVLTNYVASSTPSGSNFLWSVSPALLQAPAPYGTYDENASIIFNGTAPWTVTAQTMLNGCFGQASMIVNQVPAPTLTGGPFTACIGGQITVGPATGTGPFTWSTSAAATLVSPQGGSTATYEIHGSGSITVSNCGGTSSAIAVTATLPPSITITSTGSLCAGTLQLSAPAGGTYQWSGGSVATTQIINVTIPGSYTVQVTFPGGCKSVATFTVAPVPLPTVTISTGDPLYWCAVTPNVTFQAFTLGVGCSYQWYRNGSPFGTNSPTLNTTLAGSYYVVVTCGGCVATSNTITVVYSPGPCPGNGCTPVPPISNPLSAITVTGCNPKTFSVTVAPGCTGTVNWTFGDGGTASGTTVTHTYANTGVYGVTASITCNGCPFMVTTNAQVPVKANFISSVTCGLNGSNTINMNNTSQVLGGWSITSVAWSSTCGTPLTGSGNTYTLNTTIGCSPTVTMTITVTNTATGQVCTDTKIVPFTFASSPLNIIGPTTVCKDQTYSFSSSMTGILYQWTVNGTPVSQNAVLSYAFNGTPPNPVVGLNVTDAFGCTFSTTVTLNVVTPPALSITPSPIIKVCQAPCPTTGSVLTATPGFTNYEWFQNGVSLGAPSPANTYTITGPSPIGTYYVQAQSQPHLCHVKSNPVSVVYHPKPKAKIIANTNNCIPNVPFTLNNASFPSVNANNAFNPNYNYEWFLNNTGTPIFNSNTSNFLTYTINTFGTYTFILRVTDITTGCCNLDTICIAFSKNPTVSIAPGGPLCAGPVVTLTATAGPGPAASYYYSWENGQQGPTHLVQAPGMYSVQAMDNYGCAASAYFTINPMPYLALFPQGCDTICLGDTNKLRFPLPTNIYGQPAYTVVWSLPGGVGTTFPLSTLGLGSHTITATVTMNGCTATTAAYNVFVKNCDTCDCKESYWKEGPLWTNVTTGEKIKINCKEQPFQYVIQGKNCKDSFNLSGTYICKGTNCPGKVTFSLYDANTNAYIGGGSGNYGIPPSLPNGSYYITMYAYCGDLICDSCKIYIKKDCDKGCDCDKPGVEIIPELTINKAVKKLKCNGEKFEVSCLSNVTLNASYFCIPASCPATITYQLTGPVSQTGTLPLSLSALPAGNYSIVIMAYCGGKLCKECKLNFEVVCEKDCCPYDIKATLQSQATSMSPGNTNLLVTQGFNFTGLTGASLTEIRAEVLSYNLTSQFPEQCIGCKNLPKGWASIYNGNVMGPVIPKVNLAGVMTNAPINVSTLSPYSNPREIVWNNGGAIFSIVQPVTLGFILPKPSPLDCCDATAEICVKFTFRDKDCKECEVIICFKVVIKKK
ncbi:MAG: PKD domain-containing protein [Chitinophagaceae bacterium]|nr:PKD domain-containing protein [Chitinophagaceae bacterium]